MIFNFGKKKKAADSAALANLKAYEMKHFDVLKALWKNKVPKSGQANTVQGELLRQIEKLRNEACDNGNINWGSNFSYYCDFIGKTLSKSGIFDSERIFLLQSAVRHIKSCGEYAQKFNNGEISENQVDADMIAYTEDDLYDFISDAIAEFSLKNPNDISFQKNESVRH